METFKVISANDDFTVRLLFSAVSYCKQNQAFYQHIQWRSISQSVSQWDVAIYNEFGEEILK